MCVPKWPHVGDTEPKEKQGPQLKSEILADWQILLSITPCSPICTRLSMFPWFLSKETEEGEHLACMFENQGPGFQI